MPTNALEQQFFGVSSIRFLSLVLPSALTAVIRSDNPDEDEEFAPFESPEPSAHTAV
jgi:hypothetical protein